MVKIKKVFSVVLALIFMLLPMEAFAADLYQMNVIQAEAEKPQIVAYFNFTDTNNTIAGINVSEENAKIFYGNEELEIEKVETQKKSEYGVTYYYLIDNSTSVSESSVNKVKDTIKKHIDEKKDKDKVVVISFAAEINVVLDGTENKTGAKAAVSEIKRASGGTRLYDAIAKATDLIDTNKKSIDERSVIFIVTDGVDKVAGGNTIAEVTDRLGKSDVPIYAFGYDYASKESLDSLGELARSTRGKMTVMKQSDISENILSAVSEVQNTYRIVAYSKTNIVENGSVDLRIEVESGGEKYEAVIPVISGVWQKDLVAPKIVSVSLVDEYHVELVFSENVNINEGKAVFKISCDEEEIPCAVPVYNENEYRCVLQTEEKLYNGEYGISVEGVTDVSMEKNEVQNGSVTFAVDSVPKDFAYFINEYKIVLIIVGGVLLLILLVLIIVKTKKKTEEKREAEALKHGNGVILSEIDAVNAEITVIDSHRIERRVKCVIGGAYIIGRDDDKCDLAIEDKHLSHQHTALIYENGILSIQDLDSTNGTKVNGMRITRVRKLEAGDIVEIGNTRLRIRIIP